MCLLCTAVEASGSAFTYVQVIADLNESYSKHVDSACGGIHCCCVGMTNAQATDMYEVVNSKQRKDNAFCFRNLKKGLRVRCDGLRCCL